MAEASFEALANENKDAVYRQMLRACGNHADAEDVLMEALLRAYKSLDQLRDSAAFRAWLAQIARRLCYQLRQREAMAPLLQLSAMEDGGGELPHLGAPPDVSLAREQMRKSLWRAVDELPAEAREVYLLREIEDLGGEETAARLGISLTAMKSRLHRARRLLRERLDSLLVAGSERSQESRRQS
jgi:RNA polymerase sigma-70 factor (ECF subfamily)